MQKIIQSIVACLLRLGWDIRAVGNFFTMCMARITNLILNDMMYNCHLSAKKQMNSIWNKITTLCFSYFSAKELYSQRGKSNSARALTTSVQHVPDKFNWKYDMQSVKSIKTLGKKNFSTDCRSGIRVRKSLLLIATSEGSQLWTSRIEAEKLFQGISSKLKKSSDKVKNIISEEKFIQVILDYEIYKKNCDLNYRRLPKIYHFLSNPHFLLYSYSLIINRKVGYGIDGIPVNNVTISGIINLAEDIRKHSYDPKLSKKLLIPKPNGEMRPLGIASSRDKILQQALYLLLEPFFEPKFESSSHGFRKNKSTHTCLKEMSLRWKNVTWLIEFDIQKMFDKVNHLILQRIFKMHTKEKSIIDLINKMTTVGYINLQNLSDSKLEAKQGTPQGSIISPLFANIYLNLLDKWVDKELIPMFSHPHSGSLNSEYQKSRKWSGNNWETILQSIKKKTPKVQPRVIRQTMQKIRTLQTAREGIPYFKLEETYSRLYYVRYADDFVLGYMGPKKDALKIVQLISFYLKSVLELDVNVEKTNIKHHKDGIIFLGYLILGNYARNIISNTDVQRRSSNALTFKIPLQKLLKRFKERGFIQVAKKGNNVKYVARRLDKWLFLASDIEIVRRYKAVMTGLKNYYCGSNYQSTLYELFILLKRSAALTLASKYKLQSAKKAFNKWGKDITLKSKNKAGKEFEVSLKIPLSTGKGRFNTKNYFLDKGLDINPKGNLLPKTLSVVVSASELDCSILGCSKKADHWHHIKHRRKIISESSRVKSNLNMIARQIPVCELHHLEIHRGKYNGPILSSLTGYDVGNITTYKESK
uniref:Reverse transcriptase domain-containing protein n=1 Tax=Pyropia nitida TaxID=1682381 RepID=A0A0U2E2C2_9RHOD|nr:hypothetical protein [Pyropia nitida]AKQ53242.1 hypothetical protein [Pyropia nitida]